jgi:DNA-binding XRE family transcriptional regulator
VVPPADHSGGHEDAEAGIETFSAGRERNSLGIESIFVGRALREANDKKDSLGIGCAELGQRSFFRGTKVTRRGASSRPAGEFLERAHFQAARAPGSGAGARRRAVSPHLYVVAASWAASRGPSQAAGQRASTPKCPIRGDEGPRKSVRLVSAGVRRTVADTLRGIIATRERRTDRTAARAVRISVIEHEVTALVIVWAADEPEHVGEVAFVRNEEVDSVLESADPTPKKRAPSTEQRTKLRAELYARTDAGDLDLREAIKMMHKIAGRSQAEYARLVGVSPRALIEFERGIGNPTLKAIKKLLAPFALELTLRRKRTT